MDESTKDVPSADANPIGSLGSAFVVGRLKPQGQMGPGPIAMLDVRAEDAL